MRTSLVLLSVVAARSALLDDMCSVCFDMNGESKQPRSTTQVPVRNHHDKNSLQPMRRLMQDSPGKTDPAENVELTVGFSIAPPYVMWKDKKFPELGLYGFASDLWTTCSTPNILVWKESTAAKAVEVEPEEDEEEIGSENATTPVAPKKKKEKQEQKESEGSVSDTESALLELSKVSVLNRAQKPYQVNSLMRVDAFNANIEKLSSGLIDVIATGVVIDPSLLKKNIKFSIPFWYSGLGILILKAPASTDKGLSFGGQLMLLLGASKVLVLMLCLIFVAGNIYWLLERKPNPKFEEEDVQAPFNADGFEEEEDNVIPYEYLPGVTMSMWWAAVSLTTVGYGDLYPKKRNGKIFGLFWIFLSLFLLATFTGNIVSAITAHNVAPTKMANFKDLDGKKVAMIRGSIATEHLARYHNVVPVLFKGYADAVQAVVAGEAVAFVDNVEILNNLATVGPLADRVMVSFASNIRFPIAFAYNEKVSDGVIEYINSKILQTQFSSGLDTMVESYMQDKSVY